MITASVMKELKNFKSRPYLLKFFKGCLQQNLLNPLLDILSQLLIIFAKFLHHRCLDPPVLLINNLLLFIKLSSWLLLLISTL